MRTSAKSSLLSKYDAIVSELAKGEYRGDETAARVAADNALVALAMGSEEQGKVPNEADSRLSRSIAAALEGTASLPGAVNDILNVSCAMVRGTTARDAGAVYTPAPVACYMCRKAIGSYLIGKSEKRTGKKVVSVDALIKYGDAGEVRSLKDDLDSLRLIDTSCGTGIFLEAALEELCRLKVAVSKRSREEPASRYTYARNALADNLLGLDIEAYSIRAARTRLLLRLVASGDQWPLDLEEVKMNLTQGNALLPGAGNVLSGDFDVIVGNPPYMRVKSMFREDVPGGNRQKKLDFARAIRDSGLYHCQEGNLNLYKLFIERNLSLLREQGSMCLIVPSSFLNEATSQKLRARLFSSGAVEEIIEIPERSKLFGGVNQATCVFTCRKATPLKDLTVKPGADIDNLESCEATRIDLRELAALTGGRMEVPLLQSPEIEWAMLKSLCPIPPFRGNDRCPPVGVIDVGSVDETIDRAFISYAPTGDLFVKGIHLSEYHVDLRPDGPGPRWVRKEEFLRKRLAAARIIALPRIIGRNTRNKASCRRLKFAPLPPGILCGNSIKQIVVTDRDIDPMYLLALLNSSTLNWYFEAFCAQNNIRNYSVEALPVPRADKEVQETFASTARMIMGSKDELREFLDQKLMDAMACELYFMKTHALLSSVHSVMEKGATADDLEKHNEIRAAIDRISATDEFKVVRRATYRL